MNKDQVKGTIKVVAGKVQQPTRELTGSADQPLRDIKKQAAGQAHNAVGDAREAVKGGAKK